MVASSCAAASCHYRVSMTVIQDELDTLGLLCPLPVLRARKRLSSMPAGALLRVLADDPAAQIDFPHFCNEQGHELVSTGQDGAVLEFVIRKGGS